MIDNNTQKTCGRNAPHVTTDNGIVHIIGPELGLTTPGKTIVCGNSHTSTHGAFGHFYTI